MSCCTPVRSQLSFTITVGGVSVGPQPARSRIIQMQSHAAEGPEQVIQVNPPAHQCRAYHRTRDIQPVQVVERQLEQRPQTAISNRDLDA